MMIRQLELRPNIHVAACALFIDGGRLADHKVMPPVRMNLVAGCAGNLVLHVTALEAPHLRWLVQVATETDLVSRRSVEFAGIPYVLDREGLSMFLSRAVARLAGPSIESVPLIAFDRMMRAFLKSVVDIFMASLACLRSDIAGRKRRLGGPAEHRQEKEEITQTQINTAHAPGRRHRQHLSCDKLCKLRRATWYSKACATRLEDLRDNRCRLRKPAGSD